MAITKEDAVVIACWETQMQERKLRNGEDGKIHSSNFPLMPLFTHNDEISLADM